ncbi:MAG: hypothetical protein AAF393_17695 [Pseudomonadota bacterium]
MPVKFDAKIDGFFPMDDYFDLGAHTRPNASQNPDAQMWFDRGLNWVFGFNHEEAIYCFEQALVADPKCVLARWGIGYAVGPDYNLHWDLMPYPVKKNAVATLAAQLDALDPLMATATPLETTLVAALRCRVVALDEEEFAAQNDAYAAAMRRVCADHPGDLDVIALTAEALMMRTPWQLWDLQTGNPTEGSDTLEAAALLERAFEDVPGAWEHPGCLHLYIHLMEMSPHPERALRHGDALTGLVPDAGHMQHMGTHVDVLCGEYANVVRRNLRAWEADQKYLALRGPGTFYSTYICHDLHFAVYGAMFLGQLAPALKAAEALEGILTPEVVEPSADWMESYWPMRFHAYVRFGEWAAIDAADLPEDQELFCYSTAVILYAKGISAAVQGDVAEARNWQARFAKATEAVPEERVLFNNKCSDILAIADRMLDGEILYREGKFEAAFDALRAAVAADDALPYEEPWGWMQPARHALGALLLEQGHADEAEAVYRADLGLDPQLSRACQNPDNIWSLRGLHTCLTRRGADAEAALIKPALDKAVARADRAVAVSCFCAKG